MEDNESESISEDDLVEMCGTIFATRFAGRFLYSCALCDEIYSTSEKFLCHFSEAHLIPEDEIKVDIDPIVVDTIEDQIDDADLVNSTSVDNTMESESMEDPLDMIPLIEYLKEESSSNQENEISATKTSHVPRKTIYKAPTTIPTIKLNANLKKPKRKESLKGTNKINKKKSPPASSEERNAIQEDNNVEEEGEEAEVSGKDTTRSASSQEIKKRKNRSKSSSFKITIEDLLEELQSEPGMDCNQMRCLKCPVIFTEVPEFREHMKTHDNYLCPRCSAGFLSKMKFDAHMKAINGDLMCKPYKQPLKCHLCDFEYPFKNGLLNHFRRHFHTDNYACSKCDKVFKEISCLENHMLYSHKNADKRHKCHICGMEMLRKSNLTKHILRHNEDNKNVKCPECPRTFYSRAEHRAHYKLAHSKFRPYLCSDCGASFGLTAQLNQHRKRRHSSEPMRVECDVCSRTFSCRENMLKHMKTHKTEREHFCPICNNAFKQRKTLVNHIKIHENKRAYKCKLCTKAFNQGPALVSHMKSFHLSTQ